MIERPTKLYRHFDAEGRLLYVGIALNPLARLADHNNNSHWVDEIRSMTIEAFSTREEALIAERRAVESEAPMHNMRRHFIARPAPSNGHAVSSRASLVSGIVQFNPLYTIDEAARVLTLGPATLNRLVDEGKIGVVELPGDTNRPPRRRITGWQMLSYLEALEAEQLSPVAPTPQREEQR